ncbi:MAG: competence/damage-inducible protein A [Phycisphaerae bacterium]|nr:competence/damage-inducible protein A [Phycisphaerae bacterium]
MDAVILSIGTELVSGQTLDTNAAWLAEQLSAVGCRVVRHVTVGDELEDITRAFREAMECAGTVMATGGLGPTADDLTRQALANALGRELVESAEALAQIEALFARWQRTMSDANRLQALMPEGCEIIPNPRGTAPGIHFQGAARSLDIFVLPGVPSEMKAMFAESVLPAVRARSGGAVTLVARLNSFGMSEANVGEALADLMARDRNPLVGTTASAGVIGVRILATSTNEADARAVLGADVAEVRRRLGEHVFGEGDETLQESVAKRLFETKKTVATAESCTGGLLAKRLTDVPGSSTYFLRGYVSYSNESKIELLGVAAELIQEYGAVSEEVARAMASGCRRASGADFALSVTGVAGPGGGTAEKPVGLVYVGLADGSGVAVRRLMVGSHLTREEIRDRTCKMALNMLRRKMMR